MPAQFVSGAARARAAVEVYTSVNGETTPRGFMIAVWHGASFDAAQGYVARRCMDRQYYRRDYWEIFLDGEAYCTDEEELSLKFLNTLWSSDLLKHSCGFLKTVLDRFFFAKMNYCVPEYFII